MPRVLILSCLLAIWGLGCSGSGSSSPEIPSSGGAVMSGEPGEMEPVPPGQSESPDSDSDAPPVTLEVLDWKTTRDLVNKHQGKIVVMDLWATYCPPCVQEFPSLVKLHQDHGDQVTCISVSLDYQGFEEEPVDACREKVLTFLKKMNARFVNVICSTDSETVLLKEIGTGSIPVVYIFDREGNKVAEFPDPDNPDEFTYEAQIVPIVKKLLEQP